MGGLIGSNSGRIWAAYATGVASGSKDSASGSNNVGGLVGYNSGGIWATYATGDASGFFRVAGLVGVQRRGEEATVSNQLFHRPADGRRRGGRPRRKQHGYGVL